MTGFGDAERVLLVHAHPDDESLTTAGLIGRLRERGAAVRVITCTRGERGEVVDGPLAELAGTPWLAEVREVELAAALAVLDAGSPRFLGAPARRFVDSGMAWVADGVAGPAPDAAEDSFAAADVGELLTALGRELAAFRPDLVVSYDERGGYGHPDHVRATLIARGAAAARGIRFAEIVTDDAPDAVAVPIDLDLKRRALAAHASQLVLTATGYRLAGGQEHSLEPVERYRFVR